MDYSILVRQYILGNEYAFEDAAGHLILPNKTSLKIESVEFEDQYITVDGTYRIEQEKFFEWLSRMSQFALVPEFTVAVNETLLPLRTQNQVTIPKSILDKLNLPYPAYGHLIGVRIFKIVRRNGEVMNENEIVKLLGSQLPKQQVT